jgi:hypothetical protein
MNRYSVGFWADGVYLGYVVVWADSKTEAEKKVREERPWRYKNPSLTAIVSKV